jgi:hypothetical protein
LCAALAGAELAAVVCSATFDSFGFPMFANAQALVVGLIGAAWLLADRENRPVQRTQSFNRHNGIVRTRQLAGSGAIEPSGGR